MLKEGILNIVKDVPVRKAGPTQNLPQKSHEVMHVERRHINIVKDVRVRKAGPLHKSLAYVIRKCSKLKLNGWSMEITEVIKIMLKKFIKPYTIPYIEIIVDESLEFTCLVFGWLVPDVHTLYSTTYRCIRKHICLQIIGISRLEI